jgi:hypothetical protein
MYGSSFTDQTSGGAGAQRSTCLDLPLGTDAEDADAAGADDEAEATEDDACATADEASKLRVTAKPTQISSLQRKPYRMHASFGKKPAALISAAKPAKGTTGVSPIL